MLRTVEAIIDEHGQEKLCENVYLKVPTRALVIILDEPYDDALDAAILSESALAEGWSGPEADEAWKHLADLPSIGEVKP